MSVDSTKAFLERVKNDEDFRKEVGAQTSKEERMKFVKAQGFDFTKEEIASLRGELTEEELNDAAGGIGCSYNQDWHDSGCACM